LRPDDAAVKPSELASATSAYHAQRSRPVKAIEFSVAEHNRAGHVSDLRALGFHAFGSVSVRRDERDHPQGRHAQEGCMAELPSASSSLIKC
jgi:hypothetical protein